MKLHNRKSFISSAPEGEPQASNKTRLSQWIYILLLAGMFGYIIYIVVKPYFVISTNGIVDVENKFIFAERAGLVKEIHATSEQVFEQGSLLAVLSPERSCVETADPRLEKLVYDIDIVKTQQLSLVKEHEYLKATLPVSSAIQRALEVNASLFLEQEKVRLKQENQLNLLKYKIEQKQAQIQAMNTRQSTLKKENSEQLPEAVCLNKAVYAPSGGQVSIVNAKPATYVKKGDPIITYRDMEPLVKVVMLADIELYQDFIKQPTLTIIFPDQTESLAKIERVESVASNTSLSINEVLSEEKLSLRVILAPIDQSSLVQWRKYERMSVSVRGAR